MSNSSLAAQAVANGPMTAAPPSFDGHGWLVVLNLWEMTSATMIAVLVIGLLLGDGWLNRWRDRPDDGWWTPARVWRLCGLLFATGIGLRCGVEALSLWGWDALDPARTGRFLLAKRLVDPFAVACGIGGLMLLVLSMPGMLEQLRKEPLPIDMWQAKPVVRRMCWIVAVNLIAAIGVVSTR